MIHSRTPDWEHTLDQVAQSVSACLTSLDQYEESFAAVLAFDTPAPPRIAHSHRLPDSAPTAWDERLSEAAARADDVERLLIAEEREWTRWRTTFTQWRNRIEHPPTARAEGAHHVENRGDSASGGEIDSFRRDREKAVRFD